MRERGGGEGGGRGGGGGVGEEEEEEEEEEKEEEEEVVDDKEIGVYFVWQDAFQLISRHPSLLQLSMCLFPGLASHQSLSLSKEVSQ